MLYRRIKAFYVFPFLVLFSCSIPKSTAEKKYGPVYNEERQKRGIRLIDTKLKPDARKNYINWVFKDIIKQGKAEGKNTEHIYYVNKGFDFLNAHYGNKYLLIKKGKLVYEQDTYYAKVAEPDIWDHAQLSAHKMIITEYFYQKELIGQNPWRCTLWVNKVPKEIALELAERILRKWGIERIN